MVLLRKVKAFLKMALIEISVPGIPVPVGTMRAGNGIDVYKMGILAFPGSRQVGNDKRTGE